MKKNLTDAITILLLLILMVIFFVWFIIGIPIMWIIYLIQGELTIKVFNIFDWPIEAIMRKLENYGLK